MAWIVEFYPDFYKEFEEYNEEIQDNILAKAKVLQQFGPQLGRPHVDILQSSRHNNLKELRLDAENGIWRVAFAFDPKRKAILLVAGDKKGKRQKEFYKKLIKLADRRFDKHLNQIK